MTRYQILYTGKSTVEHFTAAQRAEYLARVAELKAKGVPFTTWNTQNNALSALFRF